MDKLYIILKICVSYVFFFSVYFVIFISELEIFSMISIFLALAISCTIIHTRSLLNKLITFKNIFQKIIILLYTLFISILIYTPSILGLVYFSNIFINKDFLHNFYLYSPLILFLFFMILIIDGIEPNGFIKTKFSKSKFEEIMDKSESNSLDEEINQPKSPIRNKFGLVYIIYSILILFIWGYILILNRPYFLNPRYTSSVKESNLDLKSMIGDEMRIQGIHKRDENNLIIVTNSTLSNYNWIENKLTTISDKLKNDWVDKIPIIDIGYSEKLQKYIFAYESQEEFIYVYDLKNNSTEKFTHSIDINCTNKDDYQSRWFSTGNYPGEHMVPYQYVDFSNIEYKLVNNTVLTYFEYSCKDESHKGSFVWKLNLEDPSHTKVIQANYGFNFVSPQAFSISNTTDFDRYEEKSNYYVLQNNDQYRIYNAINSTFRDYKYDQKTLINDLSYDKSYNSKNRYILENKFLIIIGAKKYIKTPSNVFRADESVKRNEEFNFIIEIVDLELGEQIFYYEDKDLKIGKMGSIGSTYYLGKFLKDNIKFYKNEETLNLILKTKDSNNKIFYDKKISFDLVKKETLESEGDFIFDYLENKRVINPDTNNSFFENTILKSENNKVSLLRDITKTDSFRYTYHINNSTVILYSSDLREVNLIQY